VCILERTASKVDEDSQEIRSRTFLNENIAATLTFENNGVDEEFAAETNGMKENITLKNFKVSTLNKEENFPEKKKCKALVFSSTSSNANPSDVVESTVLKGEGVLSPNTRDSTSRGRKKSASFQNLGIKINKEENKSGTINYVQLSPVDVEDSISAYTRTKSGAGSSSSRSRTFLNENIAATLTFENNGVDEEFAAETNENKENITLKNFKVSTLEKEENIPEKKKCKASVLSSTPRNANPSDVVESTVLTSTPRRTRTNQNVKYAKYVINYFGIQYN